MLNSFLLKQLFYLQSPYKTGAEADCLQEDLKELSCGKMFKFQTKVMITSFFLSAVAEIKLITQIIGIF